MPLRMNSDYRVCSKFEWCFTVTKPRKSGMGGVAGSVQFAQECEFFLLSQLCIFLRFLLSVLLELMRADRRRSQNV